MEAKHTQMEKLMQVLIDKLKHESLFIIFCIALIAFLWQSNEETKTQLIKLNVTTTKTLEQNNAILQTIHQTLDRNRDNDFEYWTERHDRIELTLKRIESKVEDLER